MADEFDNQQQPYFSKQARKFADTTERFSSSLRDKDLRTVCNEAQSFSRREPALFVGGLIAAGFLATRFLRSSGQHSHGQHSHNDDANSGYSHTPDERSTGLPMQENVPAGQASPASQASSLSGSAVAGNGAVGSSGRENGMP